MGNVECSEPTVQDLFSCLFAINTCVKKMPREYVCGVPSCTNKGTLNLPKDSELKEDWYRLLNLSRGSNSHRICRDHFCDSDFTYTGKKLRPNVKPSKNLPVSPQCLKVILKMSHLEMLHAKQEARFEYELSCLNIIQGLKKIVCSGS